MEGQEDPFAWSVDRVVEQICSRDSWLYTHSGLQIKPVLNLSILETSLRANDIDGEALLSLEDVNVKDDLGISSFGQRREIRKLIHHLRSTSKLYETSIDKENPKRSFDSTQSDGEASEIPSTPEPQSKKRRVQPENLSTLPLTAPEWSETSSLSDEWQEFLQRHQEQPDEEVLRPFNESDPEIELDSDDSFAAELESKSTTPEARLAQIQVDSAIEEAVKEYKDSWNALNRPKKHKTAYHRWMRAATAGTRKPQQHSLQKEIVQLQTRLTKFRNAVADRSIDYHKIDEVKRNCQNLQTVISEIAEREYYLEVLSSDTPPEKPEYTEPKLQAPEILADGEEIIESSESETESEEEDNMSIISDANSGFSLDYDPVDEGWNPQIPPRTMPTQSSQEHSGDEMSDVFSTSQASSNIYPFIPSDPLLKMRNLDQPLSEPRVQDNLNPPTLPLSFQTPTKDIGDGEDSDLDRPRLPQSRYRNQGTTIEDAISLASSPSASENGFATPLSIRTPPLNPITPTKMKSEQKAPPNHKYPPVWETRRIKWGQVNDPFTALCKIVYRHPREYIQEVLDQVAEMTFDEIAQALRAIIGEIQDTEDIPDYYDTDQSMTLALLFIVFIESRGYRDVWDVSEESLDGAYEATSVKAAQFLKTVRPLLRWYIDSETIPPNGQASQTTVQSESLPFSRGVRRGLPELFPTNSDDSQRSVFPKTRSLSAETDTDVDTDIDEPASSSQKRKYHVQQSQVALAQQRDDKNRVQAQEERRQLVMQRFQAQASSGGCKIIPIRTTAPYIYLDPHIAQRVKEHQIEGIQFIWRELIEDPKHQGCLLAHTMGLGKTMQVISFLVTLAQAKKSTDSKVRELIPAQLQGRKVLVVCPASLVENWYDEILMWTPQNDIDILGGTYKVSGIRQAKLRTLKEWNFNPGILIISYESLKALLGKTKNADPDEHDMIVKSLLQEPCVVIADEAHKMKNAKSAVNKVAHQIRTTSRIALTGSPLNNHLEEYHTMIDWIAPGYLGTMVQFKAKYIEPIETGLYVDSSRYEKRRSVQKLYVLKRDLAPKIDRKDISAIEKDMPQKTEFFITVPLTELQKEIYTTIIQHILSGLASTAEPGSAPKSSNAQLWVWLAILSWLCNHPSCLIKKLQEKDHAAYQLAMTATENDDEAPIPADFNLQETPVAALLPQFLDSFKTIGMLNQIEDVSLSTRAVVTQMLVSESISQNEKILIFSHSIPTLDFLQTMLDDMGCQYMRIDGSTRTDQRQNATKYFNDKESNVMVFLISTRAGGLGLNLQGANRVVIYDFSFNPSWEEQAIGRAYRLGQKKPVFVYRFRSGGTFEEAIYNKSIFKTQLFSRVVDQKNVIRHASKKIEDYLFIPTDVEQHDLSECLGKDALLDRVVTMAPSAILNLVLTETFQREDEDDEIPAEDREKLEEEVEMEQLRRTDPAEYQKRFQEKLKQEAARTAAKAKSMSTVSPHFQQLQGNGYATQFSQAWNNNTLRPTDLTLPSRAEVETAKQNVEENGESGIGAVRRTRDSSASGSGEDTGASTGCKQQ